MTTKRPIFFVVETGEPAGGVKVIGELANRLALRDWPVSIWSVNPKETLTSWFPLSAAVKWVSFFKTGNRSDYELLAQILTKQDGIKIATFWATAFAAADASKTGEGFYLTQDIESSYTSQRLMADMVMSTYQMPLTKFTTSRWVENNLPDTRYIGIGLENHWRPNPKLRRNNTVLACARIQALKGWDFLCEVARYLDTANIKLTTYGHNDKLPMFTKTDHHKFPSDAVLRRMYQECGVFISCSQHEGFALPILEAMSCGAPVVCTNAGGNEEFCQDGVNCIMTNNPLEFAKSIARLLHDRELATKLGAEAIKARAPYNWATVVDRVEQIFLEEHPSPNLESEQKEPQLMA